MSIEQTANDMLDSSAKIMQSLLNKNKELEQEVQKWKEVAGKLYRGIYRRDTDDYESLNKAIVEYHNIVKQEQQ